MSLGVLDKDLAELYGLETKVINQATRRNNERFPYKFCFKLTQEEYDFLRSQFVTLDNSSKSGKHRKYLNFAFTEQGVAMLSGVLKSDTAIKVSIQIMDAFVEVRRFLLKRLP